MWWRITVGEEAMLTTEWDGDPSLSPLHLPLPRDSDETLKPRWVCLVGNETWKLSETKGTAPFLAPLAGKKKADMFDTVNVG